MFDKRLDSLDEQYQDLATKINANVEYITTPWSNPKIASYDDSIGDDTRPYQSSTYTPPTEYQQVD